ncbi:MAG: hypothetical protein AUI91_01620 [Acidobacteria bacterium 13_1_40CM_3_56_11]|nr:MAG: hypothetical protein AUH28_09795 [Acidobacteria bacterium 13_1_40CM_56_16]OLD22600.1 MAG: hypothetical protein AUI91_01620 [Acidobacteria bacterium 13_1_40CM_3_56_11]OLD70378.1 MAG: hypothetical protein AUI45_04895 [Acidobacteria bacterium 13_1_40CM_2_56_11]
MTDRDRFGLRGSVKSSEMHRTWYSRECGPAACETEERSDVTTVEFRPDGSLQRHWYKTQRLYPRSGQISTNTAMTIDW